MSLPRLCVCIPTHRGRSPLLAELLEDLLLADEPEVGVVVCDNASADGTEEVVARVRARGLAVDYDRHAEDLGAARNIAATVARAEADFCWLVSSDDRLVPGALGRVRALLAGRPDAIGMTVHQAVMTRDMTWVAEEQATVTVPPHPALTPFHGAAAVTGALGWILSGLSSQVVRRDAWLQAAEVLRGDQLYPHVAVILAMARGGRPWLWCPEKLVFVRAGNVALPVSGERWEAGLLDELDGLWRGATAPGSPERREVRDRYLRAVSRRSRAGRPAAAAPPSRDDLRLLWSWTRTLGSRPAFWRELAPRQARRTLTPRRVPRSAPEPMPVLAPSDRRAVLTAALPATLTHADEAWIATTVRNDAGVPLRSTGPHPVHVASRWRRPGTTTWRDGGRHRLDRELAPGATHRSAARVVAPWEPGPWELELGLVQEQVAWFSDADPRAGARQVVRVTRPAG